MRHTKSAIADDDDMYITAYVDHETNNSAENMPTSKYSKYSGSMQLK